MSDEMNGAASNAATDSVVDSGAPVQTEAPQTEAKEIPSARQALEQAFAKVQEPEGKEPDTTKADRARDETGKFVKSEAKPEPKQQQAKPQDAKPVEQAEAKPTSAAPAGFTKAAQEAWAQTPEAVRADTERRIGELTQGLEKYKTSAEAFEPVRKYHDMAAQSGTTLEKALDSYVGIETAMRQNPAAGLVAMAQNLGVHPAQLLQAMAQGLQGHNVQMPQQTEVSALQRQNQELQKRLDALEGGVKEVRQTWQQKQAETTVESFAKDNPHFDEVAEDVAHMLETDFAKDLPDAYAKAVRLNPEVAAKIEAEKAPKPDVAAQTREKATRSITGSPATGSHPATREAPKSTRDALKNAFASTGLSI